MDLEGDRGVLRLDWHSEVSELWRSTTEVVRAELERRELKRRERLRRMLRRDMRPLFLPGGDEPLASVSAVLSSLAELCRRSFGVELFRRTW